MKIVRNFIFGLAILFVLTGCSLPGFSGSMQNKIKIATLNHTESQIIGHIVRLMIEHKTDLKVEMVENLGSSLVQHQALLNKEVDITASRYTGTDIAGVLKTEPDRDPKKSLKYVQEQFKQKFDQIWYDSYGFSNTYTLTVTNGLAEKENLENVTDLKKIEGQLKLGVDNSWLNRTGDGYKDFIETYDIEFQDVFPMQIGLVYQAVKSGKMDVVLSYSTDGRIKKFNLKTLEDDKKFFPPYDCSPVIRQELAEKYPEIDKILKSLAGKINTEAMINLNYESDVMKKEPAVVAEEFLEKNNFFE